MTDAQLTTLANVIRNETSPGANTKGRVADMFQAIINSKQSLNYSTATGTNTYTASIAGITAYTNLCIILKFANASTGASTLNINSIGAVNISGVGAGDIESNGVYLVAHNGTDFIISGSISGSSIIWGGSWPWTGGNFPTSTKQGTLYVASGDHGDPGDPDYVADGTWMISKVDGANEFSEYYYK